MKYKEGDHVRIKSLDWYNENKDEDGDVPGAFFSESRSRLCGTIQIIGNPGHQLASGTIIYSLKDRYEFIGEEAIEGLVEFTHDRLVEVAKDVWDKVDEEMEARYEKTRVHYDGEQWSTVFECPDGYIFKDENGNVINATKIVLEKKKPKYPKTYEECAALMDITWQWHRPLESEGKDDRKPYERKLDYKLARLKQLLICRDAYRKLAGEEMGLGKPWKPSGNEDCFIISRSCGEVFLFENAGDCEPFEFPTREMRDAFYENFKEIINECKELL